MSAPFLVPARVVDLVTEWEKLAQKDDAESKRRREQLVTAIGWMTVEAVRAQRAAGSGGGP